MVHSERPLSHHAQKRKEQQNHERPYGILIIISIHLLVANYDLLPAALPKKPGIIIGQHEKNTNNYLTAIKKEDQIKFIITYSDKKYKSQDIVAVLANHRISDSYNLIIKPISHQILILISWITMLLINLSGKWLYQKIYYLFLSKVLYKEHK